MLPRCTQCYMLSSDQTISSVSCKPLGGFIRLSNPIDTLLKDYEAWRKDGPPQAP